MYSALCSLNQDLLSSPVPLTGPSIDLDRAISTYPRLSVWTEDPLRTLHPWYKRTTAALQTSIQGSHCCVSRIDPPKTTIFLMITVSGKLFRASMPRASASPNGSVD